MAQGDQSKMIVRGYVVESPVNTISHVDGREVSGTGMARVYVATEERAMEIVAQGAACGVSRTYRELPLSEMPERARDNLLKS